MAGGPGVGIGAMQKEVYRSVRQWRERVAREEDERMRVRGGLPISFPFS
jgi:exosome complex exonuclease RRP6